MKLERIVRDSDKVCLNESHRLIDTFSLFAPELTKALNTSVS